MDLKRILDSKDLAKTFARILHERQGFNEDVCKTPTINRRKKTVMENKRPLHLQLV